MRETIKSVTTTSKRTFILGGPLLIKMQIYVYLMYLKYLSIFVPYNPLVVSQFHCDEVMVVTKFRLDIVGFAGPRIQAMATSGKLEIAYFLLNLS